MHVCCNLSLPVVTESKLVNFSKCMQDTARGKASAAGSVIALTYRGQALRWPLTKAATVKRHLEGPVHARAVS